MHIDTTSRRRRGNPAALLASAMLLAGGIAVAGFGLAVVAGTTPTALAQVATLGTPPPDAEASAAPVEALGEQDAMLAFAACMRENGVEVGDPQFDASGNLVGGLDFGKGEAKGDETFDSAYAACTEYLVALKPALDPVQQAEQTEAALHFARCMREQGLDWPDPAPDGAKFAGADVKIDKKSPQYAAAFEVCADELSLEGVEGVSK